MKIEQNEKHYLAKATSHCKSLYLVYIVLVYELKTSILYIIVRLH